ncbi:hypothetical protein BGZ76_003355 [Entomortierella beljakovae]|nr:hypothetical protein BGZ76_003355 [Entomortierella beljakovae]
MYASSRSPTIKVFFAILINVVVIGVLTRFWYLSDINKQQGRQDALSQEPPLPHHDYIPEQQYQFDQSESPIPPQQPVEAKIRTLYSLEVPEDLHLTHDIAVPRDIPAWTEADTDSLYTAVGFDMMNDVLKLEYSRTEQLNEQTGAHRLDFARTSRAQRLHKSLWNYLYPVYQALPGTTFEKEQAFVKRLGRERAEVDFFLRLEKKLYPWIRLNRQTTFSMYDSYEGKGIVVCAGNRQFDFIVSSIQAIRKLQPEMPIQIFYMGEGDLSSQRQSYILGMTTNIEVVDILKLLDNDYMQLGGWSIKAFSILASRFREVIMVDSDAYFLQDPAKLFEDPGYKLTGTLYFYDRTLFPGWTKGPEWIRSMLPITSSFPSMSRMFRGLSSHEQESGVVVINKGTRLVGLLAVCKMNSKWERDLYTYKQFYGDKESFWVGYEMVQEPFAFVKSYPGVIGEIRDDPKLEGAETKRKIIEDPSVCGAQLHLDYQEQPMWWNGGLMRNKNSGVKRDLNFGFFMKGGGLQVYRERIVLDKEMTRELLRDMELGSMNEIPHQSKDAQWIFEESCLYGSEVIDLDERQKALTSSYLRIDKVGKEDGKKIAIGQQVDPRVHDWDSM